MGRSLSFGSTTCDMIAHLRLAFAAASPLRGLARPQTVTRRFIMRKARRHPFPAPASRFPGWKAPDAPRSAAPPGTAEPGVAKWVRGIGPRLLVGAWFQVLLTPLIGVLFIIQSPYLYAIGRDGVLSLGGWTHQLHTEFHGHRATLERQT